MAPLDPLPPDVRQHLEPLDSAIPATWQPDRGYAAPPADDDQEIWLLSYSDMVTLLFSVFVMLMAITSVKDQLPKTPPADTPVAEHAQETAPAPPPPPVAAEDAAPPDPRPRLDPGQAAVPTPERLSDQWRERLAAMGMPPGVAVHVQQNGIAIDIGDAILFPTGQADLTQEGRALLVYLAPLLRAVPGTLVVEGHTDSVPITSARFPSNWELSAARAAAVVRLLVDQQIPPTRLSAVGYADTRPIAAGADPVSLAHNRRVTLSLRAIGSGALE